MLCPVTNTMPKPTQKGDLLHYPLDEQHHLSIVQSIDEVDEIWANLAPKDNIFLQNDYLRALEQYPPEKMGFRYLVFYKNDQPIGLAYVQTYFVKMEDSVQNQEAPKGFWAKVKFRLQQWFLKKAVFNVMICGNLVLTGEHGYHFCSSAKLDVQEQASLCNKGIDLLQKLEEKASSKRMHIQMFKDYKSVEHGDTATKQGLAEGRYHEYTIQPSMYMHLPEEWEKYEDYLAAMSSKYRVRAKRAAKKGKDLVKRELSLDEITERCDEIYKLYSNIANSVGFNAYTFHKGYFWALKNYLGERFKLVGLFLDGELVAFYTAIFNGKEMEAHFLGLNYEYNHSHQIYLNILYSLIDMGIYHQMEKIDFARTALEIKSSVGAVAQEMHCYMRHRNRLSSNLIKFIFETLSPEEDWTPRSPFKDMSIVQ
jgi:predicted N-acyltransferase